MSPDEAIQTMLHAHLESGKASAKSVAALYAILIAGHHRDGPDFWRPLHDRMKAALCTDPAKWVKQLDRIKKLAWSFYEDASAYVARRADSSEPEPAA